MVFGNHWAKWAGNDNYRQSSLLTAVFIGWTGQVLTVEV